MQPLVFELTAVFFAQVSEYTLRCIVSKTLLQCCLSCATIYICFPATYVLCWPTLLIETRFQAMVGLFNKIVRSHDHQLYRAVHKLTQEQRDRIVRINHEQFR